MGSNYSLCVLEPSTSQQESQLGVLSSIAGLNPLPSTPCTEVLALSGTLQNFLRSEAQFLHPKKRLLGLLHDDNFPPRGTLLQQRWPKVAGTPITLIYIQGNQDLEKLSDLPEVIQSA